MTPLTQDPNILVWIDPKFGVMKIATNIAPELRIEIVDNEADFIDKAPGKPFNFDPTCAPGN